MKHFDLIIVGGGSAGLASAIEARKHGIEEEKILLVEKSNKLGGILNQCIHTGFGLYEFKEELTGPEYAHRFIEQIKETKINVLTNTTVTKIRPDYVAEISSYGNFEEVSFKALIYAAGCSERSAGAIKLPGDRPQGVMTAGQAQNYLNNLGYLPGKNIFILGSGDIGLIMARRMTLEGANVIGVAELMPYSNGLKRNIVQCLEDFNIPLYLSTTVTNVIGKTKLESIELSQVDDNLNPILNSRRIVKCDTLLLSVGLTPYVSLLKDLKLKKDQFGKFIINEKCETSFEGVFITGNSLHVHDLVDNVTKESRTAGFFAAKYILEGRQNDDFVNVKIDKNISYSVPNVINRNAHEFEIKMRVKKPMNNTTLLIRSGERTLKKVNHFILIPSEMIIVKVKTDEPILEDIFVEVISNEK